MFIYMSNNNQNLLIQNAYPDQKTVLETDTTKMLSAQQQAYNSKVFATKMYLVLLIILFCILLWQLLFNTK
jgi:hypothetical protein